MTHGSLFSGIGGFDLAAQWMEWKNVFHCEWNDFGKRILKYYWPKAISYDDITKTDFNIHRGRIDILTGGFPCQPYSTAGKRLGKEDDRHLWPEMLRAIKEIQPRWIVGENVDGLVNWNDGLVFNEVQVDLENEGYEVQPYIIPAAGVNAPHKRNRVWFVAYSNNNRARGRTRKNESSCQKEWIQKWNEVQQFDKSNSVWELITNGTNARVESLQQTRKNGVSKLKPTANTKRKRGRKVLQNIQSELANGESSHAFDEPGDWKKFPTQTPICNGDDGLSARLDSITFPKWRTESIKGGGNAIVPQVALQIFKAISKYEQIINK